MTAVKSELLYTKEYKLLSSDVDMFRRLRLSRLFTMLQEAAIAHTEALGAGREKTLDRGLLWVVGLQRIEIRALPGYDDPVVLTSWPGETRFTMFPRYCRLTAPDGTEYLRTSAFWTLMDAESRKMIDPKKAGISIPGLVTGEEAGFPLPPKNAPAAFTRAFTVPYSWVDLNGHMNNSRYPDLAEDLMPEALRGRVPQEIRMEYLAEARCGETITVEGSFADGLLTLTGSTDKKVFRLSFRYPNDEGELSR